MNVREAKQKDLSYLVDFTLAEALDSEDADVNKEHITAGINAGLENEEIAKYWILENEDNTPIGSASATREWSDWNNGYYWWIQSMYIKPECRGKGYIELLVNRIKSFMNSKGGLELRLYVHKDNDRAIKSYKKIGFKASSYQIMKL